ncbi:hypothetical protein N8072_00725 [bacterium]|nr:hypothetical protein [bacterium]MDB4128475.1 hypothetical protein [bacterium]MDC1257186.1 hypothetical protein [bacterium]
MKKFLILAMLVLFGTASAADPIVTDSTSNSTVTTTGNNETTVNSPPPSAISPSINGSNADLCTVGASGAVQTQILGVSAGMTTTDKNCERLKLAKTMYDMGMKVAAVSIMCQDERVFDAMEMAGTPCPFLGKIGEEAQDAWGSPRPKARPTNITDREDKKDETKKTVLQAIGGALLILLLL